MDNISLNSAEKDISFLFDCKDTAKFIESCYETLFSRPMMLWEIRNAYELLAGGLPRDAFIYWLAQSAEFNGRFCIKHYEDYGKSYLSTLVPPVEADLPALKRFKRMHRQQSIVEPLPVESLKKPELIELDFPHPPSADGADAAVLQPDFDAEFNAMSLCQLSQLESLMQSLASEGSCIAVGHLANEFLPLARPCADLDGLTDCLFCAITNPSVSRRLLESPRLLNALAGQVGDTLAIAMPTLPVPSGQIRVIWDRNWDAMEVEPDGSYCRWFHGNSNTGDFMIYSNCGIYREVCLSFSLSSFTPNAKLFLRYEGQTAQFRFHGNRICARISLILKPGLNRFTFTFIGDGMVPISQQTRLIKFLVIDLSLTDADTGKTWQGDDTYQLDERHLGFGYLPDCQMDASIRSRLHMAGFFEIESFFLTNSLGISKGDTTRYHYGRELMNRDCCYLVEKGVSPWDDGRGGVMVYAAHRTAILR